MVNLNKKYGLEEAFKLERSDTIILADANKDVRMVSQHHLKQAGFSDVVGFDNGLQVLQYIKNFPKHKRLGVLVADFNLPGLGGIELVKELTENAHTLRPPAILTMEAPSREQAMHALEAGFERVLVKPYSVSNLIPMINEAIRLFYNPKNPERIYNLAKESQRQGSYTLAQDIYRDLIQVNPGSARPLMGLAVIEQVKDRTNNALELLKKAANRNPNFVPIYTLKGTIHLQLGQLDQALSDYRKGIDLSPLNPVRYQEVAEILLTDQRYLEIIDILLVAKKRNVQFPLIDHYLSKAYFFQKDAPKAIEHINQALKVEPNNISFLNQLAICYKQEENYIESIRIYNKIIKIDPDLSAILYNKSICLHAMGDVERAMKLLERITVKDPSYTNATRKLDEYKSKYRQFEAVPAA